MVNQALVCDMYRGRHRDDYGVTMTQSQMHDDAQANRYSMFVDRLNKCRTLGGLRLVCKDIELYACMMSKKQVEALLAHAAARNRDLAN
jgi:hypothetical protein